jgi:hypothetical protein
VPQYSSDRAAQPPTWQRKPDGRSSPEFLWFGILSLRAPPLLGLLAMAACSDPDAKAPSTEVLCAAEALHLARNATRSRAEEDNLRARADVFTKKLSTSEQQRLWTKIDELADKRGRQPIIATSTCDALLTPEERRALAASASHEEITHETSTGNPS